MQRRAGEATGETHEESASLAFYDTDSRKPHGGAEGN
jgi:hypothetical protein